MKRAIIVPAALSSAALDELKRWLAITGTGEDATLTGLLRAALDMCEAFTGTAPIEIEAEELLTASGEWQVLSSRPVGSITSLSLVTATGVRTPLVPEDYMVDIAADGSGRARLLKPIEARRVAVRFTAGLAPDWEALPNSMRHGIIRLAAHHYRERDGDPGLHPPAAISALWQPWRRMRLL